MHFDYKLPDLASDVRERENIGTLSKSKIVALRAGACFVF